MSKKSIRKELHRKLSGDLLAAKEAEKRGQKDYFNTLMKLVNIHSKALVML
jgi:hypothetical protein